MLKSIARSCYLLVLTVLVGAVVFYSLVVLPTLFSNLETSRAGDIAALLFPAYYRFGLVCAVVLVGLVAGFAATASPTSRRAWLAAVLTAAVLLGAQGYATLVVHPRVVAVRGVAEARAEFDDLHRRSVHLNGVVLACGLGLVLASGYLLGKR